MFSSTWGECCPSGLGTFHPGLGHSAHHGSIVGRNRSYLGYCQFHKGNPAEAIQKPLRSANLIDCGISEWDCEYINVEQDMIFELIMAANYLDIKSLLDLACSKVASMIKGKSVQEVCDTFKIVPDFSPEEEAQIREENHWCEESDAARCRSQLSQPAGDPNAARCRSQPNAARSRSPQQQNRFTPM